MPPPPMYRNLRVDPPELHKADYAVLYLGSRLPCVAVECGVLAAHGTGVFSYHEDKAKAYQVARYTFDKPAIFLPIDDIHNHDVLMADDVLDSAFEGDYDPYQALGLDLFQRYGQVIHGLSWASYHRGKTGRVFALWHHHKATIGLGVTTTSFNALSADPEFEGFLAKHPTLLRLAS